MTSQVIQSVWPVLAILAYALVTAVLTVLTSDRKKVLDTHDRVRRCMELRIKYMSIAKDHNDS